MTVISPITNTAAMARPAATMGSCDMAGENIVQHGFFQHGAVLARFGARANEERTSGRPAGPPKGAAQAHIDPAADSLNRGHGNP